MVFAPATEGSGRGAQISRQSDCFGKKFGFCSGDTAMKYINKHFLLISIIVSVILISILILYAFNLDVLQKIFSIIGSFSLGIALFTYIYKKTQDKNIAAIEQIAFFRKEIIPEWESVANELKSKNKKYMFSRIKLDEPTIEFMRKKDYSINFQDQTAIFLNNLNCPKIDPKIWDSKILDLQIKLFNMIEEFSLRVYHFETSRHQALNSVRAAFVEIIEKNAAALIFVRDIVVGNPIYSKTLLLYSLWKEDVNRSSIIKMLEKHGFITKKQKEEIFNEIRRLRKSAPTDMG